MAGTEAYEKPLSVEVYDGEIVIRATEGPFSASLTPQAAAKTAEDLVRAVKEALDGQVSQARTARD